MLKRAIALLLFFAFVIFMSGCATTGRQKDLEVQGLKNQVSVLEAQIQSKDEEINNLKEALNKVTEQRQKKETKVICEVKSRPTVKQIQMALQNAGYDPGAIDGKTGKKTREAIRAFQKANGLVADGKVGKMTWTLLKEYLYKKVK